MKDNLIQPAATIAAAVIARMPATGRVNNTLTVGEIKSIFLEAMEALEDAAIDIRRGRGRSTPLRED